MANNNHICVFDFETGGLAVKRAENWDEPLQIGAVMIDPNKLKVVDSFESLMQPLRPELVNAKALEVNGLTLEQVKAAPHPKIVWGDFTRWVKQYQKKDSPFNYPIPAGYNIDGFDMAIVQKLCEQWGPVNVDKNNDIKVQAVFHTMYKIDLMNDIWNLMENSNCLGPFSSTGRHDLKLTTLANWFGIKFDDAHTALGDVYVTAAIIVRLLKLFRSLVGDGQNGRAKFYNAFGGITAKEYLQ